jgi:type I protein arginine methyltransferase
MSLVQSIKPAVQVTAGEAVLDRAGRKNRDFPAWHFPMVNDENRNRAIEGAIAKLQLAGKTVVEIGSGAGLVALMFARHGARHVYTCEMNPNLGRVAEDVISRSAYAPRITVIKESSTVAISKGLLPRRPDIIFTETLDCGVVGEGFMPIARDIQALAGPDTLVMPAEVKQYAAVIESVSMTNLNRASVSCGFDLSVLNQYSTGHYFPVHSELHPHRFLTAPHFVRSYRYIGGTAPSPVQFKTIAGGTAHGVLSWFEADFGGAVTSTEPRSGSHWHQAFHPLADDVDFEAGAALSLTIDDEGYAWMAQGA